MNKQTPFQELAQYMDLLLDAICVVDESHCFSYVSPGGKRVFGYEPSEMVGQSMFNFMHPEDVERSQSIATKVNSGDQITHFENRYIRKDGATVHLQWSARWSEHDQKRVGVARDITKQKELEQERLEFIQKLSDMALTDPLTQLPNRSLFYDRVRLAQARATREGSKLAILYIDLDGFKHINDEFGHAAGDQLLQDVAKRIESSVRATDTVARIGGDEFVILIDEIPAQESDGMSVAKVSDKVIQSLQKPLALSHGSEVVTASIGVAYWPQHGSDTDALLNHADQAMYRAKKAGGNQLSH